MQIHSQPATAATASVHDPHRPQYHFLPLNNWMNDPNGLIQWNGQYHLFYQYNPNGPFHGTIHWGHAVSTDLVHWSHLPLALTPTPGTVDEDGCWSGCAVDDNGTPTIIYTGLRGRTQLPCLATSDDDLLTWQKYLGNPIISAPPSDLDLIGFRDHSVWREDGLWYQVIGAGINGVGGAALLYRSPDLRRWEYLHPLLVGDVQQTEPLWTGSMWECPNFFPLGDKHVLLISVWDNRRLFYTAYILGTYAEQRFTPERMGKLDFGDHYFYAPQTMLDDQGRRIMFGWIQEGRSQEAQNRAGWSGTMSLPRILSLAPHETLRIDPVPELQVVRGAHQRWANIALDDSSDPVLEGAHGDTLEISAEFEPGDAQQVGLKVRRAADGSEETLIVYDRSSGQMLIDRTRASTDDTTRRTVQAGPFALEPNEPLQLQVFLDRSVVEVFVNGRATLTSRIYPVGAASVGVAAVARGGTARLRSLDLWQMRSIWND